MRIVELTEETWPALETLFSANKTVGGCWCTWFMRPNAEVRAGWGAGNREFLREHVGAPLGLLAFDDDLDDEPAGWVAVAPRPSYPRLATSKLTRSDAGPDTWSVTCFFVHRRARGRGLAATLLAAAVDFAAERGAAAVEGHPVDTEGARRSSGEAVPLTGTVPAWLTTTRPAPASSPASPRARAPRSRTRTARTATPPTSSAPRSWSCSATASRRAASAPRSARAGRRSSTG